MDNTAGQTRSEFLDQGTPGFAVGKIVFDATAIKEDEFLYVHVGFSPRHVRVVEKSGCALEWFKGMEQNSAFKTDASGAVTLESNGIAPDERGFRISQKTALGIVAANGALHFVAQV
ncbi:hypothetical protein EII18_03050 [Comamonadaceae bacterium OH3737_COT-264]|nr:hypothetical protein EII18_03050 [Comamonadaceae bacterium OH3737_COT-264]